MPARLPKASFWPDNSRPPSLRGSATHDWGGWSGPSTLANVAAGLLVAALGDISAPSGSQDEPHPGELAGSTRQLAEFAAHARATAQLDQRRRAKV